MRSRRFPIAFKNTVLWRGEGRSLFGGAIRGEDMGTLVGNGGGGNLRVKIGEQYL